MKAERQGMSAVDRAIHAAIAVETTADSELLEIVVCECANRMEHLFGVPVLLVFDPCAFHLALVNQVVYVQR